MESRVLPRTASAKETVANNVSAGPQKVARKSDLFPARGSYFVKLLRRLTVSSPTAYYRRDIVTALSANRNENIVVADEISRPVVVDVVVRERPLTIVNLSSFVSSIHDSRGRRQTNKYLERDIRLLVGVNGTLHLNTVGQRQSRNNIMIKPSQRACT